MGWAWSPFPDPSLSTLGCSPEVPGASEKFLQQDPPPGDRCVCKAQLRSPPPPPQAKFAVQASSPSLGVELKLDFVFPSSSPLTPPAPLLPRIPASWLQLGQAALWERTGCEHLCEGTGLEPLGPKAVTNL